MRRMLAAATAWMCLCLSFPALARDRRYQSLELGSARTQRTLVFFRDLPESRRDAEKLTPLNLPCGTPVTPVAFQVIDDGADTLAFLSFVAPHTRGHILLDAHDRQQVNLLDYLLFDPGGTPFCQAKLEQTLGQCGNVGVSLTYTQDAVLQAEISNLSTNQVLFIDWVGSRLLWENKSLPVLPSDVFIHVLEEELPGKASSLLYDIHPLAQLSLVGLGNRVGLLGFAASTTVQELDALYELSKRVGIDLSEMVFEPLSPGQKRPAPLSIFVDGGWKTTGFFAPSTRGTRYTLSLPIARSTLATAPSRESKASQNYVFPQGALLGGIVKVDDPKPLNTEACTIGFTIR
jgi:hypothetical protein